MRKFIIAFLLLSGFPFCGFSQNTNLNMLRNKARSRNVEDIYNLADYLDWHIVQGTNGRPLYAPSYSEPLELYKQAAASNHGASIKRLMEILSWDWEYADKSLKDIFRNPQKELARYSRLYIKYGSKDDSITGDGCWKIAEAYRNIGDKSKALFFYKKSAEMGSLRGYHGVAACYWYGTGTKIDYIQAFAWLDKLIENDTINTYSKIVAIEKKAKWYEKGGANLKPNIIEAFKLYKTAMELTGTYVDYRSMFLFYARKYSEILQSGDISFRKMFYNANSEHIWDVYLQANYLCAKCYVDRDFTQLSTGWKEAKDYYEEAISWGNYIPAKCDYGICLYKGAETDEKGQPRYELAIRYFKECMEENYAPAFRMMGNVYMTGWGVIKDYDKAVDYYRKAMELGDDDATANLATCYFNGYGVEKDSLMALDLRIRAARKGNPQAQYDLALCYYKGICVKRDCEKASQLFKTIADDWRNGGKEFWGDAAYILGNMFYDGEGVRKDVTEAMLYWRRSQDRNVRSEVALAKCYILCRESDTNVKNGISLMLDATKKGSTEAMFEMGRLYYEGVYVGRDYDKAFSFLKKGAEDSQDPSVDAMNLLSVCYRNGRGVEKNIERADYWLKKSDSQNYREIVERLKNLEYLNKLR